MPPSTLHDTAIAYLLTHQSQHLAHDRNLLIKRCAMNLLGKHDDVISEKAARLIALQALGEIESRGNNAHVDLSTSTSFAVFVVDPVTRGRFAFTAHDLIRLAREHASQAAAPSIAH